MLGRNLTSLVSTGVLFPFRLLGFFVALEDESAVVHDLADRRACFRGDLDQIEPPIPGQRLELRRRENADLFAFGVDHPNRRVADPVR